MSQRLLEGEVMDVPNGDTSEVLRLRAEVDRLTRDTRDLDELRRRVLRAESSAASLRRQLEPLYRALQAVWGEFDEIAPDDVSAEPEPAAGGPAKFSPVWESWKTRMPGAPAKIIDAMLLHRDVTVEQLVVLTQISRKQTIYDAIHRMNRAGLIDKNGGKFSLKKI